MKTRFSRLVFAAAFGLAMALTFSCSSDDKPDDGGGGNSAQLSSSSNVAVSSSSSMRSSSSNGFSSSIGSSSSSSVLSSSSMNVSSSSSTLSSSSVVTNVVYGTPVTYEGETYQTVVIGTQTWFQRNLNYAVDGSKCGSGDTLSNANTSSCDKYGRLYDWPTAMGIDTKYKDRQWGGSDENHKGICPSGWHLPSDADWNELRDYVGSPSGTKLKARSGWNDNYNGTDDYGFSALPGGEGGSDGSFGGVNYGQWWSSSEYVSGNADVLYMSNFSNSLSSSFRYKGHLQSVRCLQD